MSYRPNHRDSGCMFDEIVIDLFAGGGGASMGIERALGRAVDVAINHDAQAVAMHQANHPATYHLRCDVWEADPIKVAAGRPVGLLWASPDCTFFSKARGAKPIRERGKKSRSLAWVVVKWAAKVRPRCICLENVEEFSQWGPLNGEGRPCPQRKGKTFRRWKNMLRSMGYAVDHRELRACDYGAPTIRKRLFLIARCDGQPITWPEATHGPKHKGGLANVQHDGHARHPYRTAASCIDWSLPCPSIFERKKPLADKTLKRIAMGIKRYVLEAAEPFIVRCNHGGDHFRGQKVSKPMCTLTASRDAHGLVVPYVMTNTSSHAPSPIDKPVPTVTTGDHHYLCAPHITKFRGNSVGSGAGEPLHTVTGGGDCKRPAGAAHAMGVVSACMVPRYGERDGQAPRCRSVDEPMATVTPTRNGASLVSAFLNRIGQNGGNGGYVNSVPSPLTTVTTKAEHCLTAAHLTKLRGTCRDGQPLDEPAPTITAGGTHQGLVAALMAPYYGSGSGQTGRDLREPSPTVTTKDRLQLVTVNLDGEPYVIVDIGMRMLSPRELYRAQGFPDTYLIDPVVNGRPLPKSAQVRMCGNSVCPPVAEALVRANCLELAVEGVAA